MWKVSLKPALRAMLCIAAASLTLTACESKKDKDSKETGDVWFAGTVYDPLAYDEDESIGHYGY